jgi:O-antigen ligase
MGATLAFFSGLVVCLFSIALFKNRSMLLLKYFSRIAVALLLLGGVFFIFTSLNQGYRDHFEQIIVGRFEKSSGGRLDLWARGIDSLVEHNVFLWGVGLENFRVVDAAGADNQLHNDTLAFLVERGLIGVLGLGLFAGIATVRAISVFRMGNKDPNHAHLELIIFLGIIAATVVE